MLSILLGPMQEWWVSSTTFDRLFQAALDSKDMPRDLEYWHDVAYANGGMNLYEVKASKTSEAAEVVRALRRTAERELAQLRAAANLSSDDESYRLRLFEFLELSSWNSPR